MNISLEAYMHTQGQCAESLRRAGLREQEGGWSCGEHMDTFFGCFHFIPSELFKVLGSYIFTQNAVIQVASSLLHHLPVVRLLRCSVHPCPIVTRGIIFPAPKVRTSNDESLHEPIPIPQSNVHSS
ncbi:hypothetical protein CAEBREN_20227 [Caenorhabditis brenneri]|uniref:Uncharacterized protein n=1 Tax=Caenorhabditis brenneri TaxID=135651 RepID=G0PL91_CAEBE|nr:hypothetical protein CAEBREN_20227 [Caenorhabditis brenneri]